MSDYPSARPSESGDVDRFVSLDFDMPGLLPTPDGPRLNMVGAGLRSSGLKRLMASPNMRFVTQLDLRDNGLVAADMLLFRGVTVLQLGVLNLARNPIGDEGLDTLLRSGTLMSLWSLDLSDTGVSDACAALLAHPRNHRLRRVVIQGTTLDIPTWKALAERFRGGLNAQAAFTDRSLDALVGNERTVAFRLDPGKRDTCFRHEPVALVTLVPCALHFRLRDVLRLLIESRANGSSFNRWASGTGDRLIDIRGIESRFLTSSQAFQTFEDNEGLELLRVLEPLALDCDGCRTTYLRPKLEFRALHAWEIPKDNDLISSSECIRCPAGHPIQARIFMSTP